MAYWLRLYISSEHFKLFRDHNSSTADTDLKLVQIAETDFKESECLHTFSPALCVYMSVTIAKFHK